MRDVDHLRPTLVSQVLLSTANNNKALTPLFLTHFNDDHVFLRVQNLKLCENCIWRP